MIHFETVVEPLDVIVAAQQGSQPTRMGQSQYVESVESLIRNNIQRVKKDMANEIIDAGKFDQQTKNEERVASLEEMLGH